MNHRYPYYGETRFCEECKNREEYCACFADYPDPDEWQPKPFQEEPEAVVTPNGIEFNLA